MLKRSGDIEKEIKNNMRGGTGEVTLRHYFKQSEITAPCRLCAEIIIPPGAGIGLHDHTGEDEIYIIQKGRGILTDDGIETEIAPGDAVLTGKGGAHSIRNAGGEDLVFTAVIMLYSAAK